MRRCAENKHYRRWSPTGPSHPEKSTETTASNAIVETRWLIQFPWILVGTEHLNNHYVCKFTIIKLPSPIWFYASILRTMWHTGKCRKNTRQNCMQKRDSHNHLHYGHYKSGNGEASQKNYPARKSTKHVLKICIKWDVEIRHGRSSPISLQSQETESVYESNGWSSFSELRLCKTVNGCLSVSAKCVTALAMLNGHTF
jgi:hypothetical protein